MTDRYEDADYEEVTSKRPGGSNRPNRALTSQWHHENDEREAVPVRTNNGLIGGLQHGLELLRAAKLAAKKRELLVQLKALAAARFELEKQLSLNQRVEEIAQAEVELRIALRQAEREAVEHQREIERLESEIRLIRLREEKEEAEARKAHANKNANDIQDRKHRLDEAKLQLEEERVAREIRDLRSDLVEKTSEEDPIANYHPIVREAVKRAGTFAQIEEAFKVLEEKNREKLSLGELTEKEFAERMRLCDREKRKAANRFDNT